MRDTSDLKAGDIVWVKSDKDYRDITKNKVYKCEVALDNAGRITIDSGFRAYILLDMGCAFLNGDFWDVFVSEKTAKYYDRFGQLPPKELEDLCWE